MNIFKVLILFYRKLQKILSNKCNFNCYFKQYFQKINLDYTYSGNVIYSNHTERLMVHHSGHFYTDFFSHCFLSTGSGNKRRQAEAESHHLRLWRICINKINKCAVFLYVCMEAVYVWEHECVHGLFHLEVKSSAM